MTTSSSLFSSNNPRMIGKLLLWLAFAVATLNALAPESSLSRRAFVKSGVVLSGAGGLLSSSTLPFAANAANLPETGARAPDFELPSSRGDGSVVSLKKLTSTGKWTVLYFYPGAFTSGCTLEARGFQKDMPKYKDLNTQIVGVSVDPVEKNAQFCSTEGLDFYMLSDTGGAVSKRYGSALAIPGFGTFSNRQTYLIDPKGSLRWVFTDVESRIARHSSEVVEKLTELQA